MQPHTVCFDDKLGKELTAAWIVNFWVSLVDIPLKKRDWYHGMASLAWREVGGADILQASAAALTNPDSGCSLLKGQGDLFERNENLMVVSCLRREVHFLFIRDVR